MPSAGGRMPRACDAIDMDGDLVCNLAEEHPGAHNDPIYGEWFSTERALLADMRDDGGDFPCCGPGGTGHSAEAVAATIAGERAALQAGYRAHRRWLKGARMARRPVTKT